MYEHRQLFIGGEWVPPFGLERQSGEYGLRSHFEYTAVVWGRRS